MNTQHINCSVWLKIILVKLICTYCSIKLRLRRNSRSNFQRTIRTFKNLMRIQIAPFAPPPSIHIPYLLYCWLFVVKVCRVSRQSQRVIRGAEFGNRPCLFTLEVVWVVLCPRRHRSQVNEVLNGWPLGKYKRSFILIGGSKCAFNVFIFDKVLPGSTILITVDVISCCLNMLTFAIILCLLIHQRWHLVCRCGAIPPCGWHIDWPTWREESWCLWAPHGKAGRH